MFIHIFALGFPVASGLPELGDDKLILMTSSFDVLCETPLHTTEFGESLYLTSYNHTTPTNSKRNGFADAPTALGWGAKHTQFHGSLGKSAAQVALDLASVGLSPDDDMRPRISWRGDGVFFVVSAVSPSSTSPPVRFLFLDTPTPLGTDFYFSMPL